MVFSFTGDNVQQEIKQERIRFAIVNIVRKYKPKNYAPRFLTSPSMYTACCNFLDLFLKGSDAVVMELLSLYAKAAFEEGGIEKHDYETIQKFNDRKENILQYGFDRFAEDLNEIFSQFDINYKLTRLGFVPLIDEKIIEHVYDPVIKCLSSSQWRDVNSSLSESPTEYRRHTPDGFSTCVTKAVTALQAFLQTLVTGKTGKG